MLTPMPPGYSQDSDPYGVWHVSRHYQPAQFRGPLAPAQPPPAYVQPGHGWSTPRPPARPGWSNIQGSSTPRPPAKQGKGWSAAHKTPPQPAKRGQGWSAYNNPPPPGQGWGNIDAYNNPPPPVQPGQGWSDAYNKPGQGWGDAYNTPKRPSVQVQDFPVHDYLVEEDDDIYGATPRRHDIAGPPLVFPIPEVIVGGPAAVEPPTGDPPTGDPPAVDPPAVEPPAIADDLPPINIMRDLGILGPDDGVRRPTLIERFRRRRRLVRDRSRRVINRIFRRR